MAKRYDELADELDELALHYRLENDGQLAHECQIAGAKLKQVEFVPPDPADIEDISERVRDFVGDFRALGHIPELQEMREKHPYLSSLTRIAKVGPKTAQTLYEEEGATDIKDIRELADDGRLEEVSGIGPKTATTIRRSIAQINT